VSDRCAEQVFASISGRQIGAGCTGTYDNDLGFTAGRHRFHLNVPHGGRCHRWSFRLVARDLTGNVSPAVRVRTS
jgi:hypothetical protein